jgi:5-(aminomethyl)-3-furanmethanol phosphate kinase
MNGNGPIVVKVGGSLLDLPGFPERLQGYLDSLAPERCVVVVGGGAAVDFLRALDFTHAIGEKQAHALALRALELTAHAVACLVSGLVVVTRTGDLSNIWRLGKTPVFSPREFLESLPSQSPDALPESWSTTSDSIAARLAVELDASALHLLKSAGLSGVACRRDAAERGLVDPVFPAASRSFPSVRFVNLRAAPPTIETLT